MCTRVAVKDQSSMSMIVCEPYRMVSDKCYRFRDMMGIGVWWCGGVCVGEDERGRIGDIYLTHPPTVREEGIYIPITYLRGIHFCF